MTTKDTYQKTVLPNGLRVITSHMHHTRSVSVGILLGVGSRYETAPQSGISHFIEHLLFKGTARRPTPRDIAVAIEGVGGILDAGTDKELTVYWAKVARPYLTLAWDVLADMLLNARFDPRDIENERQVILEELKMLKDSPEQRVDVLMEEVLWGDHPLGRDIAGSEESVAGLTREMVLDYRRSRYWPGVAAVSVAGDIQHEEIVSLISPDIAGWDGVPGEKYLPFRELPPTRVRLETRDTEQAHLCLSLPGVSIHDPRRYALGLLNIILGEGMSSRLFTEIRENLGLAYSIHSYPQHFQDTGALTIYAGVHPQKLEVAIKAILAELAKLRESVPEEELTKARELSKGRLLLRLEDSRSVAGWYGVQEVLTGRILNPDQVVGLLDKVTTGQLLALARELLVVEKLRLAVVGPVKDRERLEALLRL